MPVDTGPSASPSASPSAAPDDRPDPRRWRALAVCLAVGFMTLLDVSIVNVALPSIARGTGAGENALSWIVSGYALAFGLFLVPAGRLGDARGRRRAFQAGVLLFTLASAACGLAPGPRSLVAARLVQGLAGGVVTPQVSGLIQQLFRGAERGRAFGLFGAVVGISTAVGPVAGGALIAAFGAHDGWRSVFFVNVPLGLLVLPLAQRFLPADRVGDGDRHRDLDPVGVGLLGLATASLLVPLIEQQSWHSPWRLALYPAAALLLVVFWRWERGYRRRGREPLVDLSLFARRSYSLGSALGLVYFAGFTGVFFTYTQFLQEGLGLSALQAGLAVTPFAVGSAVAAARGGSLVDRLGRPLVAAGLALVVLGVLGSWLAVHLVTGTAAAWATGLPLLVAGVGSGFVITPNIMVTLSEVPVARAGVAGGVLQTGQRIGAAAGIALTGSVFYGRLAAGGRPDWSGAVQAGFLVIAGLVGLALVLAVLDVATDRR